LDNLLARLDEITGVGRQVAQIIHAEVGTDMSRFANADHLVSWASLAPSKNESAGRNRSACLPEGNRYLRAALVEAAHVAGHSMNTYLGAQFRRLAARRGKKAGRCRVISKTIFRGETFFSSYQVCQSFFFYESSMRTLVTLIEHDALPVCQ